MTWLPVLRAGYGVAVLVTPDALSGHLGSTRLAPATRRAMQVLAARQLFEAAACAVDPTRCVVRLETIVDAIHGITMAGLAVVSKNDSSRRAAAVNVLTAAGFVGADIAVLRRNARDISSARAASQPLLRTRDRVARAVCDALPSERR